MVVDSIFHEDFNSAIISFCDCITNSLIFTMNNEVIFYHDFSSLRGKIMKMYLVKPCFKAIQNPNRSLTAKKWRLALEF